MKTWKFKGILTESGWESPGIINTNNGLITYKEYLNPTVSEEVDGYALPGMQNAHSHAFQYAMIGLGEIPRTGRSPDSFWSWRKKMYEIALQIDPDTMEATASRLYAEMVHHGYTNVAEFHYLHHDTAGRPYSNTAETSLRLVKAAENAGINITIIPILYQKGGLGKKPDWEQRRFVCSEELYHSIVEECRSVTRNTQKVNVGVGIHSLRAVDVETISTFLNSFSDLPLHLHVAEQLKEVEDSKRYLGKRPVEWLLENTEISDRYNLVHATHMTNHEIRELARTDGRVILCPSTEGNLGDGLFPMRAFFEYGGNWTIGTDSHIGLNPFEELRWLDYGQRLLTHERMSFPNEDPAAYVLKEVILQGKKSMGYYSNQFFEENQPFNTMVVDAAHPLIASSSVENILPTLIYHGDNSMNRGTIVNGEWIVKKNHHIREGEINRKFISSIKKLGVR